MKKNNLLTAIIDLALFLTFFSFAQANEAVIDRAAPNFTLPDTYGQNHSLATYKGKIIVLEWLNPDCPFVGKLYKSGKMQALQKTFTAKGVVWLTIISSAPGKQGYRTPEEANQFLKDQGASPSALLLDPEGKVGKLYGAKTTPHMFIINTEGILVYNGAIDSIRSTKVEDVAKAKNYVEQALNELLAGKEVTTKITQPYGCSVKYKS